MKKNKKSREDMTYNERLEAAGVETVRLDPIPNGYPNWFGTRLRYNGVEILRPDAGRVVAVCKEVFGIDI